MIENMSFMEFWIGVPVTTHLRSDFSAWTALDIMALGFLITWPSSRTTLSHWVFARGDFPCRRMKYRGIRKAVVVKELP